MAIKPTLPVIGNDPITGAEITKEPLNEALGLVNDYAEDVSQDLNTHIASTSAHLDSSISNTSNVAGTSVKDAVNNVKSRMDSHVGGSDEKHTAGVVTVTPVGSISATEVQTALEQVDSRMASHVAGTTEKHGSDDVLNESSVVGTNVSGALNTVQQQVNALVVGGVTNTTIGVYSLTAGGTVNAYTGTFAGATLFGGLKVNATFNTTNTGASTFNFNSTGVKAIKVVLATGGKSDLKGGELYGKVLMEYDGTDFVVVEKNFLNGGTSSTPVTVTQPITSLPSSVVKSRADWKVEGNTLYQQLVNGDFANNINNWVLAGTSPTWDSGTLKINASGTVSRAYQSLTLSPSSFAFLKISVKLESATSLSSNIIAQILDSSDNFINNIIIDTTKLNVYQDLYVKFTVPSNGIIRISLGRSTTQTYVAYFDSAMVIPLTGTPYESYTADQMNALVTMYFEGLQGVKDVRAKSVGNNLFDRLVTTGVGVEFARIDADTFTIKANTSVGAGSANLFTRKFKSNTRYTFKCNAFENDDSKNTRLKIIYTDGSLDELFVPTLIETTFTFTSDSGKTINALVYDYSSTGGTTTIKNFQINEGTTALPYEPYTETESYLPVTLNKLPNLTRDSVDDDGIFVKRIDSDLDVSSTQYTSVDLATYTNVDVVKTTAFTLATTGTTAKDGLTIVLDKNGVPLEEVSQANIDLVASVGKYYYHTDKTIWFIVANGAYADIATARTGLGTTKAYYQLATPITTQLQVSNLIAEPSGTIYVDNIYSDVDFYGTNITVAGRTFSAIDRVLKIDKDTGAETDITSTCTLTAGKDGFTSTSLVSGDLAWFALESTGTMIPTLTYSYALDFKAAVEGNSKAIQQVDNQLSAMQDYIYNPVMQVSVTTGFLANWSGLVKYSKNKEGLVNVYVDLLRSADILATAEILSTLPLGYRPAEFRQVTTNLLSSTDVSIASSYANISINTAGQITILPVTSTTLTNARSIMVAFSYYSA